MSAPYPPDQTPSSSRISPPSSITPTRRNQQSHGSARHPYSTSGGQAYAQDEYGSPTTHLNVFLASSQQGMAPQPDFHFGGSSGPSSAEQSFDENYGFTYHDFQPHAPQGFPMLSGPAPGMSMDMGMDHVTLGPPVGTAMQDDDRTPVIPDTQHHVDLPSRSRNSTAASAQMSQSVSVGHQQLHSPFSFQQQQKHEQFQTPPFNHPPINMDPSASASASSVTTASLHTPLQYIDPSHPAFQPAFSHTPTPQNGYPSAGLSSHIDQYGQMSPFSSYPYPYMPHQQMTDEMAQSLAIDTPYYSASHPELSPTASFSTEQSRQASPEASTSNTSVTTSAALARSQSLSAMSSTSRFIKPKPKLSHEDKRKICELAASKTALRQEDIAQMFGVDRSTISKIVQSSHRWLMPPNEVAEPQPKPPKPVGGRFPAIEDRMHTWMDWMFGQGQDVRDSLAKDKAKEIAKELGFKEDRFKASAKWLDKFKERRKAMGKPVSSSGTMHASFYPSQQVWPAMAGASSGYAHLHPQQMMGGPSAAMIMRSESQATLLSSTDSGSQDDTSHTLYAYGHPTTAVLTQSTPNLPLMRTSPLNVTVPPLPPQQFPSATRQRSQSSPHRVQLGENVDAGMDVPSSGKAQRHSRPLSISLSRQNSYQGASSPSPRRPAPLSRANSAQTVSRSRPRSLAASAFGITPISTEEAYVGSPLASPAMSVSLSSGPHSAGMHNRSRSDVSLAPLGHSMGGMTISPDLSETGDMSTSRMDGTHNMTPLTPYTPAHYPGNHHGHIKGGSASVPTSSSGTFLPQDYSNLPDEQVYVAQHFAAQQAPYHVRPPQAAQAYNMPPGHDHRPAMQGQQEFLMMHH